jgi:dihydropteroate synthase
MLISVLGTEYEILKPAIMGILNTDPQSFTGDGLSSADQALARGNWLLAQGSDILDIGGASSKPGAVETDTETEWFRIGHLIGHLAARRLVSVDTVNPEIVRRSLKAGAQIINDMSGGTVPSVLSAVAEAKAGYVLARNLRHGARLDPDPIKDLVLFFRQELERLETLGIKPEQVLLDPGIGFRRATTETCTILRRLPELIQNVTRPVLIGASRKGFIGEATHVPKAEDRLPGSLAVALHALECGASVIRVHDVAETLQAQTMWQALKA